MFYGRGRNDAMVPRDFFACAEAYLDGASGAVVTRRLYDIGHEIDPAEMRDVATWFVLGTGPNAVSVAPIGTYAPNSEPVVQQEE